MDNIQESLFGKTSSAHLTPTEVLTSGSSSTKWLKQGRWQSNGQYSDAQYFGVPQRRRRVFVIAIFDPVLANRCPNPLLPVAESLPGHLAKGKPKRQSAARTLTEGTEDGAIATLGTDVGSAYGC
jgi:site-specific DNA-cytosine methylase